MKKCIECGVKLELEESFVDPAQLCDDHWHLWWYIGMFVNEDGTLRDADAYPNVSIAVRNPKQELHYYNRIKNGERFKNWKKGNEVEND